MKKYFKTMLITIIFLLMSQINVFANTKLLQKDISITINNEKIVLQNLPAIFDGRILLPIHDLNEYFNFTVEFDHLKKVVTINESVIASIGENNITIDGKPYAMEIPSMIINERAYFPLRFIIEAFDYDVSWNPYIRLVEINTLVATDENLSESTTKEPEPKPSQAPPTNQNTEIEEESLKSLYIGNINSKKFHLNSCSSLPKRENQIGFTDRQQAVYSGYTPCKICKP